MYRRHPGILRVPLPLTGAAALPAGTPFDLSAWLRRSCARSRRGRQLVIDLERAWFSARASPLRSRTARDRRSRA